MKASEVVKTIPDEIRDYAMVFVRSKTYEDEMAPPNFVQDIVWLGSTRGSTQIDENVVKHLEAWLAGREEATAEANRIIDELAERHPVPSRQELLNGARLPEYIAQEWFTLLSNPISHKHDEAMRKGREWLQSH